MGAAIGRIGMSLVSAAGLVPRPGADAAIVTVRIGRVIYVGSAVYVVGVWYWGWRNERVEDGSGEFPIPGLFKGRKVREGASDAEDVPDATPGTFASTDPLQPPTANLSPSIPPTGLTGKPALLEYLGRQAGAFGITATEHPKFGGVKAGAHNPDGYHPKGRAIDFVGAEPNLATFAAYVDQNFRADIAELIWAGPQPKSVKNGASVPSTFWGDKTWNNHRRHVHLAM